MKNKFKIFVLIAILIFLFPLFSFPQLEWSMFEGDEEESAKPVLEVSVIKKTGNKVSMSIKAIYPGMVKEEVRSLLGDPDEINLKSQVWYYSPNKLYIRFNKEDRVIAWQRDLGVKCPYCGEVMKVIPVIYGAFTPDMIQLLEKKEIIEGGRYSTKISPLFGYKCPRCDADFSTKDPGTRIYVEIRKSLKYRPPKIGKGTIKETVPFDKQRRVKREDDE